MNVDINYYDIHNLAVCTTRSVKIKDHYEIVTECY